jgi:hypothetical protein
MTSARVRLPLTTLPTSIRCGQCQLPACPVLRAPAWPWSALTHVERQTPRACGTSGRRAEPCGAPGHDQPLHVELWRRCKGQRRVAGLPARPGRSRCCQCTMRAREDKSSSFRCYRRWLKFGIRLSS